MDHSNREEVKSWFAEINKTGWFNLIDIVYDNKPDNIVIKEVFAKYAGLYVYYEGENDFYQELVDSLNTVSHHTCEICGKSARKSYIDGWETTLCDEHFESAKADYKSR
jgi:hypothetical protein